MKAICSLGDNISEGSEKLLQRGRGEGQDIGNFGEGGVHAINHIFSQKVSNNLKLSASHKEQSSP